ncbi:hypothetical protein ONZ45_g3413 [Pleurotus djamor]|nr:hypothetical protein ONZ45_g3413 [Pleurotus djamor]
MPSIINFLNASPTLEDVDRKIWDMRKEIRILEQYRNDRLLIVSRLPLEVLSLILEYVTLETKRTPCSQWLPVTQVCRSWRITALNTPRMWGRICGDTTSDLAKLLLERAKSAPLYLRRSAYHARPDTVSLFFKRPAQIKEIELCFPSAEMLTPLANTPLPSLERLSLTLTSCSQLDSIGRVIRLASGVAFPSLQHLELVFCTVSFQDHQFNRLVSLRIELAPAYRAPLIPVLDLLNAMSEMHDLESLTLLRALGTSGAIPEDTLILIPRLTCIRIDVWEALSLSILSHIVCPSITSLNVSIGKASTVDTLAPAAKAFYALIPHCPISWEITLRVGNSPSGYGGDQTIIAISVPLNPGVQSKKYDPPLFQLSTLSPPDFSTGLLLSSLLPNAQPRILTLYVTPKPAALQHFMRTLVDVEELRISNFEVLKLILSDTPLRIEPLERQGEGDGEHMGRAHTLPPLFPSIPQVHRHDLHRYSLPGQEQCEGVQKAFGGSKGYWSRDRSDQI